jgi:hypothetical protein
MADEPIEPVHEVKPIDNMVHVQPHRNRRSYFRQYLNFMLELKHWQGWWRGRPPEPPSVLPPEEELPSEEESPSNEESPQPDDHSHINRQV